MRIINRTNPSDGKTIFWRTFKPDDSLHFIGLDEGRLKLNDIANINPSYASVQIELKWGGVTRTTIKSASSGRTYNKNSTVVLSNSGFVEIDSELAAILTLGGWEESSNASTINSPMIVPPEFVQVLNVAMTFIDGLAVGFAKTSVVLGLAKGGVGLATSILGMFGNNTEPAPLSLSDITKSLRVVINESEAQSEAAKIISTCKWFETYVNKSTSLSIANELANDLSEYDKAQFQDELDEHLDSQTPFLESMAVLKHKNEVRKFAIPQFIMGAMLHLNLERLNLVIKNESSSIDVHDINKVIDIANGFIINLQQSESDFIALRKSLIKKYPLMLVDWEDYTTPKPKSTVSAVAVGCLEAQHFGRGITVKYLSGDRWLIFRAIEQIKDVVSSLENININ